MDPAVTGGIFAIAGVVLGAGLNELAARRGRKELIAEQRGQAAHSRELEAAELLDEALVRASLALDRGVDGDTVESRYSQARDAWQEGWIAHSPRVRQPELIARVQSVGSILTEAVLRNQDEKSPPLQYITRAIADARATLAHFLRGEPLPPAAFPGPQKLTELLGRGDGTDDRFGPLRDWLGAHPGPEFHPSPVSPPPSRRRLMRGRQRRLGP